MNLMGQVDFRNLKSACCCFTQQGARTAFDPDIIICYHEKNKRIRECGM